MRGKGSRTPRLLFVLSARGTMVFVRVVRLLLSAAPVATRDGVVIAVETYVETYETPTTYCKVVRVQIHYRDVLRCFSIYLIVHRNTPVM